MKQTFKIPTGCKEISIEQVGDKIVTTFEKKEKFKKGDILFCDSISGLNGIIILENGSYTTKIPYLCHLAKSGNFYFTNSVTNENFPKLRFATDSEKQLLFDALAHKGKQWNAEKLCIEDLKVVPKVGDCCRIDFIGEGKGIHDYLVYGVDNRSKGNIFSTRFGVNSYMSYDDDVEFIIITKDQFQSELNALGFEYNFENDTISDLKWKPKEGELYYYIMDCVVLGCRHFTDGIDMVRIDSGNCFKTS